MRRLFILFLAGFLSTECHPSGKGYRHCAYDLITEFTTYNTEGLEISKFRGIDPFYYYNGALVELVLKEVNETTISGEHEETKMHYDTIGVLLIDPVKQRYVQFDSFYLGAKVVSRGLYKDAPIGVKLSDFAFQPKTGRATANYNFRDTVVNGNTLKFEGVNIKGADGRDSASFRMYYLDDAFLFTPFMIQGFHLPNSNLVLAGFDYLSYRAMQKIRQLVEHKRAMSSYELSICKRLEAKGRSYLK